MSMRKCCNGNDVKKGPWTREEDEKLLAYIQEYGHGRWQSLPHKAGLRRCGKSCRLRWKNYLCPDIKRGKFTWQEEQTIIHLHALPGNRWSVMATHLPGRTDNEIKNHWHSHLKKRLIETGIDPMTHKPKNHALLCGQSPKESANLCHTAQWETARLEAEALQGHVSGLRQNHPPAWPQCLDIPNVWAWTHPRRGLPRGTINEPQSSRLNFSTSSTVESFNGNYSSSSILFSGPITLTLGQKQTSHNINYLDRTKGIIGKTVEVNDVVMPVDSSTEGDELRFACIDFGKGFVTPAADGIVGRYSGSCLEDNESTSYLMNMIASPIQPTPM